MSIQKNISMERSIVSTPSFGDIAFSEEGTGPAALFIHGIFLNADLWAHQVTALAGLRRCIAVDLLAHGMSPCPSGHLTIGVQAQMVVEFLDALDLEQVDVVGNDTGGAICQILAATYPDRIRSMTLTNSDVHDNFPPEAFLPVKDLATQGFLAEGLSALAGDPAGIRGALATSFEEVDAIADETLLGFFKTFANVENATALQDYIAGMEPSETVAIEQSLSAFAAPTLIVWATDDVFFPVKWADWLESTIPGVIRSVRVEGARLFFPLERPEALVDELRQFWSALQ